MRRFKAHSIGLDRGSVMMFSDFEDGGKMWTGQGPRESRRRVAFSEPFIDEPVVMVSISMWDLDQKTNVRADIPAEKVSTTGFELVFRTWGDTRVARARIRWMAIGPVHHEDDWELY